MVATTATPTIDAGSPAPRVIDEAMTPRAGVEPTVAPVPAWSENLEPRAG